MSENFETRSFGARLIRVISLNIAIALTLGIVFWFVQSETSHLSFFDEVLSSFIHAAIYGLFYGFSMPYLGERLSVIRVPWNWISITTTVLLIAAISTLVIESCLFGLGYLTIENFWREYFYKSFSVFFIALVICLSVYLYEGYRGSINAANLKLRTHELEKERALKLATEAQVASLESRLHPHFLFNALNSISALIAEDPLLADNMVQRLASLLRSSLDACARGNTSIEEEIKLVQDYLEIEKVRFRERLRYSIDVSPEIMCKQIPTMILQPIVENSVKFAVSPRPEGGEIRISARLQSDEMVMEVWDDGPGFTPEMIVGGHGLDNLRSRLATLLGDNTSLTITSKNQGTVVAVMMRSNGLQKKE
jgi:sensor histidine kinase YesM